MGKIELDHTGSGSGITLSSDGTDLLLNGTAVGGGGGGADLYAAETTGSTDPTATGTLSLAIGSSADASNTDGIAIGQGATTAGQYGTAVGRLAVASNYGATAIGGNTDATANEAVAIGWTAQSAGVAAVSLGTSYASGADGFAAAIANNTSTYGATGANSIAIGKQNKSTGSYGLTIGGQSNTSSGFYSGCLNTNAGTASQIYSTVINGYGTTADVGGKIAFGTSYSGWTRNPQTGLMTLFAATTDATATELLAQNTRVSLPNNSAYAFHGTIVAREQAADGTDCAAWKVEGLIRREGTASTTVLVNSATTVIDNTPSWTLALSADTTNGALKITGTGAAATDIRWVATIHTSEVTYA